MKRINLLLSMVTLLCAHSLFGQGTLIYDQQSATNFAPAGAVPINQNQLIGQSFTPSLSGVGFFQIGFWEVPPSPLTSATIAVNLWAGSLGGTLLGSTAPITLPANFYGVTNFFFGSTVSVVPGTTYHFQPVIQSGGNDRWSMLAYSYDYQGGTLFVKGQPDGNNNDAWFREGIVVPEPAPLCLMLFGLGGLLLRPRIRTTSNP